MNDEVKGVMEGSLEFLVRVDWKIETRKEKEKPPKTKGTEKVRCVYLKNWRRKKRRGDARSQTSCLQSNERQTEIGYGKEHEVLTFHISAQRQDDASDKPTFLLFSTSTSTSVVFLFLQSNIEQLEEFREEDTTNIEERFLMWRR